jgi:hypothetical protein
MINSLYVFLFVLGVLAAKRFLHLAADNDIADNAADGRIRFAAKFGGCEIAE